MFHRPSFSFSSQSDCFSGLDSSLRRRPIIPMMMNVTVGGELLTHSLTDGTRRADRTRISPRSSLSFLTLRSNHSLGAWGTLGISHTQYVRICLKPRGKTQQSTSVYEAFEFILFLRANYNCHKNITTIFS